MSPLFMDTGYEPSSPGSLSAEESNSNTAGSEREGEGQQTGNRGTKRQAKNRDAARKSRKKQTERADVLHEELQGLERSNSALQKEIASLKKDLHSYTTALERHKPFCCLKASSSSTTTSLAVSPPADCRSCSSPPGGPPPASSAAPAAAPSHSTSLVSSLGLQTLGRVESVTGLSAELFASAGPETVPYSVSFSAAGHSLFSEDPPSLITSGPTHATPVCTSLVSNPLPPSCFPTAAQPQSRPGTAHECSTLSGNIFSTLDSCALDAFLMKQGSSLTASCNVVPPYSHLAAESAGLVALGCPMNVPQRHPGHFGGNPANSSLPRSRLPLTRKYPALPPSSASPQANLEASPAPAAFALKSSYSRHLTPSPASLLSLLTIPSPLSVPHTTSSIFDGPLPEPLPPLGDPSGDLSLSELLEVDDWILQ